MAPALDELRQNVIDGQAGNAPDTLACNDCTCFVAPAEGMTVTVQPSYYQQQSFIPGPMQQSLAAPAVSNSETITGQHNSGPPQDGGLDWDSGDASSAMTQPAVHSEPAAPAAGGRRRYSAMAKT